MTQSRLLLMCGVSLLGFVASSASADATPYGFASNQITGIAIQGVTSNGTVQSLTTTATSATGNTSAGYGSGAGVVNNMSGPVGSVVDTPEATSGPGPTFPGQNNFGNNAGRTLGFVGARSDSLISAGVAGSVTASNVAEAFGTLIASGTGKNTAAIDFTVTLATPEAVRVSFSDTVFLEGASSLLASENANATIKNDFTIRSGSPSGPVVFSFTPTGSASGDVVGGSMGYATLDPFNANTSVNSLQNSPPDQTFAANGFFTAQSAVLAAGTYDISVDSASLVSIVPGTPVPEPTAFGYLTAGLAALACLRFLRRRSD